MNKTENNSITKIRNQSEQKFAQKLDKNTPKNKFKNGIIKDIQSEQKNLNNIKSNEFKKQKSKKKNTKMKTQMIEKRQMTPDIVKNLKQEESNKIEKTKEVVSKIDKNKDKVCKIEKNN